MVKAARITSDHVLLIAGIALYLFYLLLSDEHSFTQYLTGHDLYIFFIEQHHALPHPDACWECFQPPLYYVLAWIIFHMGIWSGLADPMSPVRFLSLIFYLAYIYYARRLINENVTLKTGRMVALALVIFWPLGVTKTGLINNDGPLAMSQVAGFYYLMRWWKDLKSGDMAKALLWNALAINFKQNGVILSAIIVAVVAYRWCIRRFPLRSFYNRSFLWVLLISLILGALPLARTYYYYRIAETSNESLMIASATHQDRRGMLDVGIEYYLTFDPDSYLNTAFFDPFHNRNGRQYFWNSIFKTSLFGTFPWKWSAIAITLSKIELGMALYLIATTACLAIFSSSQFIGWMPFLLFTDLQLAALMASRALYPYAWSVDYRCVYALTPILAVLYGRSLEWYEGRGLFVVQRLGDAMAKLFVVLSVLFVILQMI